MKTLKTLAVIGLITMFSSLPSWATPLGLETTAHFPDLGAFDINVSYVANNSANNFLAQGITGAYTIDSNQDQNALFVPDYTDLSFNLIATITSAGHLSGGTLTILGSMDGTGNTVETLLTGNLIAGNDGITFGSKYNASPNEGNDYFEFLFTVNSANSDPSVVTDFGGPGAQGGIVISPNFGSHDSYFKNWGTSFSNSSGNGDADAFPYPVPEPDSILLVLVGGVLNMGMARCRRNKSNV
jgi:hypothetical protein